MNRRRGVIWLVAGLVLALLAAGLSYFAFQQIVTQQQTDAEEQVSTQPVVVARQTINERATVSLADLTTEERPLEEVPSGAIFKTEDAVGRVAIRSFLPDQILLAQYLVESFSPADLQATDIVTGPIDFNEALGDELVAYAMPAAGRLAQEGILLAGDHIDLLFTTIVVGVEEGTGGDVSVYAIQDLEVLQVIFEPPPPVPEGEEAPPEPPPLVPKTVIVAVDPQDAVVLKYAIDTQTTIDVVLRAEENQRVFEVNAVTINTIADRYEFVAPSAIR
jgi:Flp pilus assembly protein CpaB